MVERAVGSQSRSVDNRRRKSQHTQRPQRAQRRARTFDEGLLERRRPDRLGLALDCLPALPG